MFMEKYEWIKSVIWYEWPAIPPVPVWNFPSGTGLSFQGTLYDNDPTTDSL